MVEYMRYNGYSAVPFLYYWGGVVIGDVVWGVPWGGAVGGRRG